MDASALTLGIEGLQGLLDVLIDDGYEVDGPVVSDGAIVVRPITSVDELPRGWGAEHEPGHYRLTQRENRARFGWAVGPQAWKPILHPARVRTMDIERRPDDQLFDVAVAVRPSRRRALLGVRPCEVAAIGRLDRVLLERPASPEPVYADLREVFVVAVDCNTPASTCFCTSMGTGPHLDDAAATDDGTEPNWDLRLTELVAEAPDDEPRYVVRHGSDEGRRILARLTAARASSGDPCESATEEELGLVEAARRRAVGSIRRHVDTDRLRDTLPTGRDWEGWDEIADRCLACGNCTAVCPTCFCTSIDDIGDLDGRHVERWRSWSSCFDLEFSRLGDRPVRTSTASRYRQWYTHKFATWFDQFDESGCVGCGRCITWCPVGIDVTAEATRLLAAGGDRR